VFAFGLSLVVHCGLILAFLFGRGGGSGDVSSTVFNPVERLMVVDVGIKEAAFSDTQDENEVERNSTSVTDVVHLASSQDHQQASKVDAMFPLLKPVKPYYFAAKDLTQKPLVSRDVPADLMLNVPDVPSQAARLQILISEYGDVDQVIVENSLLPEAARKIVVDAFSKLKFHPGEMNGIPVKSQLRIEVMLEDTNAVNKQR
jgi:hypothetical protein